jgi:tripartite ATP-independent transporter DctM subunit
MEWWMWFLLIIGSFLVLLGIGLPVFLSFMVINTVMIYILWGGVTGMTQFIHSMFSSVSTFVLLPVPLFVLMGEIIFQSGIFNNALDVLDLWMGRVRGRLCLLSVAGATIFSALSGSSMGTTAMLGSLLLPEMKRRGYDKSISIGSCMSGALAMIIPPSALAVILGSLADISIGKLLISGVLPGVLMAILYVAYIVIRCKIQPSIAPPYIPRKVPLTEMIIGTVKYVLPFGSIIFCVIGLIILGIATPTEAAAAGTLVSFILTAIYGKLNWNVIIRTVEGTLRVSIMMFTILTGATAFGQILNYTGASQGLLMFVLGLDLTPYALIFVMMGILIIMGMLMEQVSIMMVTIPIFMPIARALDFNPIWFGLLFLINMEIGMKSPPFGLCLFVMQGIVPPEISTMDIYKSVAPFIFMDILAITVVIFFPQIATFLPNLMTH